MQMAPTRPRSLLGELQLDLRLGAVHVPLLQDVLCLHRNRGLKLSWAMIARKGYPRWLIGYNQDA